MTAACRWFFTDDTMDGRWKSLGGNQYAQVMANRDFFAVAYPMSSKTVPTARWGSSSKWEKEWINVQYQEEEVQLNWLSHHWATPTVLQLLCWRGERKNPTKMVLHHGSQKRTATALGLARNCSGCDTIQNHTADSIRCLDGQQFPVFGLQVLRLGLAKRENKAWKVAWHQDSIQSYCATRDQAWAPSQRIENNVCGIRRLLHNTRATGWEWAHHHWQRQRHDNSRWLGQSRLQ